MIISASRRTDIPAFYANWFFNRLKEGFVVTRNPFNAKQLSKIRLDSSVVDAIVFWTKNPAPMIDRLKLIDEKNIPYYFQFTITPYKKDLEPGLPINKNELIETFKILSSSLGSDRVIWRYDPILFNERYTPDYHKRAFSYLARSLSGYTNKCVISFLDMDYNNTKNIDVLGITDGSAQQKNEIAKVFSAIATEANIVVETCAEEINLEECSIKHGCCIDADLIEKISGKKLISKGRKKDPNQRALCGCIGSIDIGMYNTCKHGCAYCYANYSKGNIQNNCKMHNPISPLLLGECDASKLNFKKDQRSFFENSSNTPKQLRLLDELRGNS